MNLKSIKNLIQQAEDFQKLTEEVRDFVLSLDVDNVTVQQFQQGLKYLVDMLNILYRPLNND